MTIDLSMIGHTFPPVTRRWDSRDAILYALGVGAGQADPTVELAYTTEHGDGAGQMVLPTFVCGLLREVPLVYLPQLGDFSLAQVLHAEQSIELHGTLPAEGEAVLTTRVVGILDKGSGALIETVTSIEAETMPGSARRGTRLAEMRYGMFVRGEGGFGTGSARGPAWQPPDGPPDETIRYETSAGQALLYRLTGDLNPLHSDPEFARLAGFARPILHGLCVYGFAGRALLQTMCGGEPSRFGAMGGRFTRPVTPGSDLLVHVWTRAESALFQVRTAGEVVLDRGVFRTTPVPS